MGKKTKIAEKPRITVARTISSNDEYEEIQLLYIYYNDTLFVTYYCCMLTPIVYLRSYTFTLINICYYSCNFLL